MEEITTCTIFVIVSQIQASLTKAITKIFFKKTYAFANHYNVKMHEPIRSRKKKSLGGFSNLHD